MVVGTDDVKAGAVSVLVKHDRLADPAELILPAEDETPYRHSADQLDEIATVIRQNGWRVAVVVTARDGKSVVKGAGLVMAALKDPELGPVPIEVQKYRSKAHEQAERIADQRVTEYARRDEDALKALLEQCEQHDTIGATGYDEEQLKVILERYTDPALQHEHFGGGSDGEAGIRQLMLTYQAAEAAEIKQRFGVLMERWKLESWSATLAEAVRRWMAGRKT